MRIVRSPEALRRAVRAARARGRTVGFVPTMGFLHEGHLALARRARRECDLAVASIFVNPLQFGPREDFAAYPRAPRRDRALLRGAGIDLCFEPRVAEFYPAGYATRVEVGPEIAPGGRGPRRGPGHRLDAVLCGRYRPGHFAGVTTVVAKLLAACGPDRLYLGAKDYQQALIIGRMVRDLNLGVRVVLCPTVRETDGLALSSRNTYLAPAERAWAPALHRALRDAAAGIRAGSIRTAAAARQAVRRRLAGGLGRIQYVEVLSAGDLSPVDPLSGRLVLALACFVGKARLIDNVVVRAPGTGQGPAAPGRQKSARATNQRRKQRR